MLKNKLIIRFQNVNLNISILILTYSILTKFFEKTLFKMNIYF